MQASHTCRAKAAQLKSQVSEQHNGNSSQTAAVHRESSQPGVPLFVQQSPSPVTLQASHTCKAKAAQLKSQGLEQHSGRISQTVVVHWESSQPGVGLFVQQSPVPVSLQTPHISKAAAAQLASQELEQHCGIVWQMRSLHWESSQSGVPLSLQQSPPPVMPQASQNCRAKAAQSKFQTFVQHSGRISQTRLQHSKSSQPGDPLKKQQSPAFGLSHTAPAFTTVTPCVCELSLPQSSTAVQVTIVVPTGNGALQGSPSSREQPITGGVQLSDAVGVPRSTVTVPSREAGAITVTSSGAVIWGGVPSRPTSRTPTGIVVMAFPSEASLV